jgi:sRNA-binding protein
MEFWTQQTSYLQACTLGATRINLEGNPVGVANEFEAKFAADELAKREKQANDAR